MKRHDCVHALRHWVMPLLSESTHQCRVYSDMLKDLRESDTFVTPEFLLRMDLLALSLTEHGHRLREIALEIVSEMEKSQ